MSEGKWITGLTAPLSLEDAARRVLTLRLNLVRHYLTLTVTEAERDTEHVHQLRVSTRRAGAALDLFAGCLPSKPYKHVRRGLRDLRRAVGAARDWDVFGEMLREWAGSERAPAEQPGIDLMIGYALGQRAAAQVHLAAVGDESAAELHARFTQLVAGVSPPVSPFEPRTLTDLALTRLQTLMGELRRAVETLTDDYEHLHAIRIIGKRLRYVMEVFVDLFNPEFREQLYPAVETMQEILGLANDSHVAQARLTAVANQLSAGPPPLAERLLPGVQALRDYHAARMAEQRRLFLEWWPQWLRLSESIPLPRMLRPAIAMR